MAPARWFARAVWLAVALAAGLGLNLALSSTAQSPGGWSLCNDTSFVLEAATGKTEGRGVIVEGWTRLRPGECRVALEGPLKPGVSFVFARSSKAHRGGQRVWNGDVKLCVDPNGSFAVESPASCTAMGLESRGFQAVRIDRKDRWTTRFREAEPYDKSGQTPLSAGLQRLLDDAGIDTVPVDGYIGRKSRSAIQNFLAERKLSPTLSDRDVIDILEDVARNRSLEVGMMLCNRTDHRIWAAIARRRSDTWESRGWWSLDATACVRTVDESLISTPHYVFAEMDTPQGKRYLSNAQTTFCTARTKFAILGRDNCDKRAFRQEAFAETPSPEDGKLVYEFFERNFGAPKGP